MLAFMDESGNTGFRFDRNSSPYFVVTVVAVADEDEVEKISLDLDELKAKIRNPAIEFHYTNTDGLTRRNFFNAIRMRDFKVIAVVYDKRKLIEYKDKHTDFLLLTFGTTLEHARDRGILDAANVKYDAAGGNAFQRKLASHLLTRVNGVENGRYIKRCEPQNSRGNNLIQLADMICGTIARPYNKPLKKEEEYLKTIKHRVDSVLEWP